MISEPLTRLESCFARSFGRGHFPLPKGGKGLSKSADYQAVGFTDRALKPSGRRCANNIKAWGASDYSSARLREDGPLPADARTKSSWCKNRYAATAGAGTIAIVSREMHTSLPASSAIRISHTWVARPT